MKKLFTWLLIAAMLVGCSSKPVEEEKKVEVVDDTPQILLSDIYKAYYEVLDTNKAAISSYEASIRNGYNWAGAKNDQQCAVLDITGDDIPELIFFVGQHSDQTAVCAIYSYIDDQAKQVYASGNLPVQVAGGDYYALFKTEKDGPLYFYNSAGDESWSDSICSYKLVDGQLEEDYSLIYSTGPTEDYSSHYDKYTENGKELSKADFDSKFNEIKNSITNLITWNTDHNASYSIPVGKPSAKTVQEMMAFLASKAGIEMEEEVQKPEVPAAPKPSTTSQAYYFFPGSDSRLISESELQGMNYDECQLIINEIYARRGRRFVTPEIQAYFDAQSWYSGTIDANSFTNDMLSSVEQQNINTVVLYEQRMGWR